MQSPKLVPFDREEARTLVFRLNAMGVALSPLPGGNISATPMDGPMPDAARFLIRGQKEAIYTYLTTPPGDTRPCAACGRSVCWVLNPVGVWVCACYYCPELRTWPGNQPAKVIDDSPKNYWTGATESTPAAAVDAVLQNALAEVEEIVNSQERKQDVSSSNEQPEENRKQAERQPDKPKWEGGIKRQYKAVPTAFADTESGLVVFGEESRQAGLLPRLSDILAVLPESCSRVYLTGKRPGEQGTSDGLYKWLREPAVGEAWETGKLHIDAELPVLTLANKANRSRVLDIRRAAAWFGEGAYGPYEAREALATLDRLLQETFDTGARTLTTPGSTGLALWDRGRQCEYPVLSEDYQELLTETNPNPPLSVRQVLQSSSGQGRIELCPLAGREELPGFVYLDGRFMYGALALGLGFGPVEHDRVSEFEPLRRGRYLIRFTVPPDWQHVGIFAVKREEARAGWWYPGSESAGQTFETWADSSEIRLAMSPPAGLTPWHVEVVERFLLSSASKGHPWPLDVWSNKLITLRQRIATEPDISEAERALLLTAARAILLHGVGSFARSMRDELVIVYPKSEADIARLPAQYSPVQHEDGTWTYTRPVQLSRWSAQMMHPEFSASIWARCRTHLLYSAKKQGRGVIVNETGALLMPRDWLVGFRTDAIYATSDPGWPDDGVTPGQFRLKGKLTGTCQQPGTPGQPSTEKDYRLLNTLRDRSEAAFKKIGA